MQELNKFFQFITLKLFAPQSTLNLILFYYESKTTKHNVACCNSIDYELMFI